MLFLLALSTMTQSQPGPVDAFRSNVSSIKAAADFDCKIWYNLNPANLKDALNFEPGSGPAGEPGYAIEGRWEHVDSAERYVVRVMGGSLFRSGASSGPMPSVEALSDGETFAFHYLNENASSLRVHTLVDKYPIPLVGPLTWYSANSFDRDLKVNHVGVVPLRSKGERGGHPTEIEVYEKSSGEFKIRVEVAYDPSVAYLPRYCRGMGYGQEGGRSRAGVDEWYLTDAKPCSAGGFVPTEWYQIRYEIDDFASKYPNYDEKTKLVAPSDSTVVYFKISQFEDKKDQPRLQELAGLKRILAPGGITQSKNDYGPMTLAELKAVLGIKATPSNRPTLPNIDQSDLHEFDRRKGKTNWVPYLGAGLVLAAVVAFVARRRARMIIGLIGLVGLGGCGQKPVPRLTAGFVQTRLLYDPSSPTLKLDLVVNNAGNQTLRIMKVDAGCSCRHVDPAQLPATVRPGESVKLAVGMSGGKSFAEQTYLFTFTTDQGPLTAPVALLSIPRHHLSPDTITMNGLYEASPEEQAGFDLVHREVYEPGRRDVGASLVVPAGFVVEDRGVREGRVAGAPEFAFRDSDYRLTLRDRALGLHRAEVVVRGADGRKLVEAPLVWQRLPFLSSVPERVSLAGRPARVFLRCPDEAVELARVLATPRGIKAELDSPRSLRVALTEEAPATLQDFVEVETTAAGPKVLRIPVARYSSVAARP